MPRTYKPKHGSYAYRAVEYLRYNDGRVTSADMAIFFGMPPRTVYSYMIAAIRGGAVTLERATTSSGSVFVLAPPEQCAVLCYAGPGGVSVSRPAVARDVWAYCQGGRF